MSQVLNSISSTANTTKTLQVRQRETQPQGYCSREDCPLLAEQWQSTTDYCFGAYRATGILWIGMSLSLVKKQEQAVQRMNIKHGSLRKSQAFTDLSFICCFWRKHVLLCNWAKEHISFSFWLSCQVCPLSILGMQPSSQGLWRAAGPVWMNR